MKQESTVADNCNLLLFTCPQPGPIGTMGEIKYIILQCFHGRTSNQVTRNASECLEKYPIQQRKNGKKDIQKPCEKN